MRQKGFAPLIIVIVLALVGVLGVYYFGGLKNKTSPIVNLSKSTPTPDPNHGYKLFEGLFEDSKYGFSFNLPGYFGRHGDWESNNDWEKDANPDHLSILPFETAKQEDAVFKYGSEEGRVKEISISVSKNTTIDKWRSKTRSVFNSQADGWGLDHKYIKQDYDSTNKNITALKFTYLDQVLMPENPQAGDEYDTNEPVTGVAIQKGSNVIVISMKHGVNYQAEVDSLFTQILSTFKFIQ